DFPRSGASRTRRHVGCRLPFRPDQTVAGGTIDRREPTLFFCRWRRYVLRDLRFHHGLFIAESIFGKGWADGIPDQAYRPHHADLLDGDGGCHSLAGVASGRGNAHSIAAVHPVPHSDRDDYAAVGRRLDTQSRDVFLLPIRGGPFVTATDRRSISVRFLGA